MSKDGKRQELYISNLSQMIQKETVSQFNQQDLSKFREFQDLLRELFPHIFDACEFMDFDGSFLLLWRGENSVKRPIMFMNHHDVVPAEGEWLHEPFSAEIVDGKMWGRGTLDTKSGLWGMLQAADELAAEGVVPCRDIYFESGCNEETTGDGADAISRWMQDNDIRLEMSFDEGGMAMYDPIGGADGTFAMVGVGEKGCAEIRFTAQGNGGHASTPGKNTPLVRLGRFMTYVDDSKLFDVELSPTICEMFRRISPYMGKVGKLLKKPEKLKITLSKVLPRISDTANALIQTTVAFTMAEGSDARNVLPAEASVIANVRTSHHQGGESSIEVLRQAAEKFDLKMEILDPGFESGITDYNGTAFELVEKAVKVSLKNVDATVPYIMTGASDSRFFDRVCDQCIRFNPFTITEEQMESIHGINENIDVDTLVPAVDYYRYLMTNC
ncbi:MAG: M20/M25/M40 family metallo-hydrolase [Clostridiales bacterium]|nr:M20/M25/M40 family metallo-hydrolase [Candidatus Crickella equi]